MRYFFDISDRAGTMRDADGVNLGTFEDMCLEARRTLAHIAGEEPFDGHKLELSVRVRDEQDRDVYELRLSVNGTPLPAPGRSNLIG